MCGRFLVFSNLEQFQQHFPIEKALSEVTPNFNVAPTQEILTIFRQNGLNLLEKLHWGLVPHWTKDRPTFYKSIPSVRENDMDMTVWLDYFITGLETQMIEVRERGEQVIRRDVMVQKHGLNERQGKAIEFLLKHGKLTIQDFEMLCPDVNRRSLQRDLKGMLDKELVKEIGAGPTDPTRHYTLSEL
jgi:hypothetical protein